LCESAEITGESVDGGYAEYISALEEFVLQSQIALSPYMPRHFSALASLHTRQLRPASLQQARLLAFLEKEAEVT